VTARCSATLAFEYEDDQLRAIRDRLMQFARDVEEELQILGTRHRQHVPACDICRPEVHE
jgi:glutamine synthetase type III